MGSISAPDPFILTEKVNFTGNRQTAGLTLRSPIVINGAQKTLLLIAAGQSNISNRTPTLYTPTNASAVDNFNVYDGAIYSIGGPLLGADMPGASNGPGNIAARIADTLITNANFNRVILVPLAIGSTSAADWATGFLADRIPCAIRRLSSRGVTPATTGVTFGLIWLQGEQDTALATSQSTMTSELNTIILNTFNAGFSGRFFVTQTSYTVGSTSTAVTAAQAAVVNGTTVFSGGNTDAIGSSGRQSDNIHWNDTGAASVTSTIITAMHSSGAPY